MGYLIKEQIYTCAGPYFEKFIKKLLKFGTVILKLALLFSVFTKDLSILFDGKR